MKKNHNSTSTESAPLGMFVSKLSAHLPLPGRIDKDLAVRPLALANPLYWADNVCVPSNPDLPTHNLKAVTEAIYEYDSRIPYSSVGVSTIVNSDASSGPVAAGVNPHANLLATTLAANYPNASCTLANADGVSVALPNTMAKTNCIQKNNSTNGINGRPFGPTLSQGQRKGLGGGEFCYNDRYRSAKASTVDPCGIVTEQVTCQILHVNYGAFF